MTSDIPSLTWSTGLFDQFRATAHASLRAFNAHDLLPAVSTLLGIEDAAAQSINRSLLRDVVD